MTEQKTDGSIDQQFKALQDKKPVLKPKPKAEPKSAPKVTSKSKPRPKKDLAVYETMRTVQLRKYAKKRGVRHAMTRPRLGLVIALRAMDRQEKS
jgi:hypothetical protein